MKPRILLIGLIISLTGLFMTNPANAQFKELQLIEYETNARQDIATTLHFFENKDAVTRFREVELNDNLKSLFTVESEDLINLNLFSDVEFTAEVQRVEEIMEDNVTITAKLVSFDFAYMIIATTEGRSLVTIRVPEKGKIYQIIGDPATFINYLIEIDHSILRTEDELPSQRPPAPTLHDIEEQKRIEKELEIRSTGPWDPATIDVMIVYTQAARTWGNSNGGLRNIVATAIADGNIILSNSNTVASFRLVHNAEVDYTESPSLRVDLRRLTTSPTFQPWGSSWTLNGVSYNMLGFMDDVHTWRNTYGADLVLLFTSTGSGIGWLLNDIAGKPNYGFSISNISRLWSYTPTHEKGHNMGLHHHKEQTDDPGPTDWGTSWSQNTWSAGWRWEGSDNIWYHSVMSYTWGNPDGGRVPRFSNPSINHMGQPTGHTADGNNARTVRTSKHVVAAYRSTASISCISCPGYDFSLSPLSSWQTHSSTLSLPFGCKVYRVSVIAGRTYIFQTGCGNGATANFNTLIEIMNNNCDAVAMDMSSCESNRSRVEWVATYDGYAYVKIRYVGTNFGTGTYTMAYQRPHGCNSNSQWPSTTLTPESNWKYQSGIFPGEYSRFNVSSGTTYTWSLCNFHGGDAPYDSQLSLRHGTTNSLIAYSDDECGTGLDAIITWTADFTGNVKAVISKYYCQGEITPTRLAYKSGTLTSPYVNITPANRNVLNTSGSVTYNISSNTVWTLSKNVSWITSLSQTSGSGNATITVNYNANTSSQRVGTITASAFGISNVQATLTQLPGNDPYCNSLAQFGGPLTPTDDWQYHSGIWAGEFVTFNVTNGTQYHWSLCPEHGGNAPYDSELTLRRHDNNLALAYNNNACGDDARISWTADYTGIVKLVVTRFPCESQYTSTRIAYKSGALVNIAVALTPENRDRLSGAGTTYYYVTSNTSWTLAKNVSWITSLTPSSGTGNATIAVAYTANSGAQRIGTITASSGTFSTQSTLTQMPNDAQCNSVSQWGGLLEPEDTWKYLHGMWAGEYARFSIVTGTQYHWSLCPAHGGNATYDSRLTLRNAATNAYLAHNTNFCGDDGKITWTADFTGEVKVIVTKEPCDNYSSSTRLAYKSGTLANPSLTLTPAFHVVGPLGGAVTYNLTSNTTWTLSSDQSWSVPSQTWGTGDATITMNYDPNTGSSRMATFTGVASYGPTVTASLSQYDYCNNSTSFLTWTPFEFWQYVSCIYAGEYATFPVVEGQRYHWSLCEVHGGYVTYNSELTLRKASDNSFLAYANDNCGPGLNTEFITWDADFTGNVRLHVNKVSCESLMVCTKVGFKTGNLDPPFLAVSPENQQVSAYAGSITFDLTSNSDWMIIESVPWLSVTPLIGNGNGTLTISYDENTALSARSGEITISSSNAPDVMVALNQAEVVIPENESLPPFTVAPGVYQCYNASQSITVEYFTILSGGMLNLVAGHNIRLLEGTHARSGSYLHAWISDVDHCGIIPPPAILAVKDEIITQPEETPSTDKFFKVYPNPTTGTFTLELADADETAVISVEIYSMLGESLLRTDLPPMSHYQFDLSGRQPGIYLIRVMIGDEVGVEKLIKQ